MNDASDDPRKTRLFIIVLIVSAVAATAFGWFMSTRDAKVKFEAIRLRDSVRAISADTTRR